MIYILRCKNCKFFALMWSESQLPFTYSERMHPVVCRFTVFKCFPLGCARFAALNLRSPLSTATSCLVAALRSSVIVFSSCGVITKPTPGLVLFDAIIFWTSLFRTAFRNLQAISWKRPVFALIALSLSPFHINGTAQLRSYVSFSSRR